MKPLAPELTLDVLYGADDVNLAAITEFDLFVPLDLELDVIASPAGIWLAGAMEGEEPICALNITSWHGRADQEPLLHCSVPHMHRLPAAGYEPFWWQVQLKWVHNATTTHTRMQPSQHRLREVKADAAISVELITI